MALFRRRSCWHIPRDSGEDGTKIESAPIFPDLSRRLPIIAFKHVLFAEAIPLMGAPLELSINLDQRLVARCSQYIPQLIASFPDICSDLGTDLST